MSPSDPNFTYTQQYGIVVSSTIIASISLSCSVSVLISYLLILNFRPREANRISLRLTTLACACDSIFSIIILVISYMKNSTACHVFAYFLFIAETCACICLTIIGFHLVMILVAKVSHPQKLEKYYYIALCIILLIIVVVPIVVHGTYENVQSTCWYHYFFVGRSALQFNWVWYYSWLFTACAVAAICAALAIRKVMVEHDNFAGLLDMLPSANSLSVKHAPTNNYQASSGKKNNSQVFRKIVCRSVYYPLVPLVSKGCGIGIQIATMKGSTVGYPVYVVDRVLSGFLGLFVSIIYFTDPAVVAVIREFAAYIKRRYVDDYYYGSLPRSDFDSRDEWYPFQAISRHTKPTVIDSDSQASKSSYRSSVSASLSSSSSPLSRLWKYIYCRVRPTMAPKKEKKIPLHRIKSCSRSDRSHPLPSGHNNPMVNQRAEQSSLEPFPHPRIAQFIHWILVSLFRVRSSSPILLNSPATATATATATVSRSLAHPAPAFARIKKSPNALYHEASNGKKIPPNMLEPNHRRSVQHHTVGHHRRSPRNQFEARQKRRLSTGDVSQTRSTRIVELHSDRRARANHKSLGSLRPTASSNTQTPFREPKALLSRFQSRYHVRGHSRSSKLSAKKRTSSNMSDDAQSTSTQQVDPDYLFYSGIAFPSTPPLDVFAVQLSPPPAAPRDTNLQPLQFRPLKKPSDVVMADMGLQTLLPSPGVMSTDGFHEAYTSLHHILNWYQESPSDDRLQEQREPWDVDNMIEKQIHLAGKRPSV